MTYVLVFFGGFVCGAGLIIGLAWLWSTEGSRPTDYAAERTRK